MYTGVVCEAEADQVEPNDATARLLESGPGQTLGRKRLFSTSLRHKACVAREPSLGFPLMGVFDALHSELASASASAPPAKKLSFSSSAQKKTAQDGEKKQPKKVRPTGPARPSSSVS